MILSYSKNFLYIKTQKTGGTSLEVCLSKYCSTNDIITPIQKMNKTNESENLRKKISNLSCQNYIVWRKPFKFLNFYKIKKYYRYSIIDRITKNYFYNHMPLCDVKKLIKPTTFKNLFKFAFVRNPFDQFLSLYFWANGHNEKKISFEEFTNKNVKKFFNIQKKNLFFNNKVNFDKVFKYEEIDISIKYLKKIFHFDDLISDMNNIKLLKIKKNYSKKDYFNKKIENMIYKESKIIFEKFY